MELKTQANIGIVYFGYLEDLTKVLEFIKSTGGEVIFIKKSVGKLWIKEGKQ